MRGFLAFKNLRGLNDFFQSPEVSPLKHSHRTYRLANYPTLVNINTKTDVLATTHMLNFIC